MPSPPSILLVKTSSLGDVIHNLPVVADIRRHHPTTAIDWVCEAPYAELVRLNANIRTVLPINLRHLKRHLFSAAAWRDFGTMRRAIHTAHYDLVIDTQGLAKSALVATFAQGTRAGYARDSAREPLASFFYSQRYSIARDRHAVERNRALVAAALGYTVEGAADYGLTRSNLPLPTFVPARYVVFLHATSRADKRWPRGHWIALGNHCNALGFEVVLPWGTAAEAEESHHIAAALQSAAVPEALALPQAAALLAHAALVVGVDTGLAHLAVAVDTPTIGIYVATDSALTGLHGGPHAVNLGGIGHMPHVAAVQMVADLHLRIA